jgi:AAA+ ATPase superfamily predicted ATPase
MDTFIGRRHELKKLNEMWDSGKFECAVIYGRRRVGKTTLINEFTRGKDTIFFSALETTAAINLENFSGSIMKLRLGSSASSPVFQNFQTAFDSIYELAADKRVCLVIDEYPNLAASYQGISSLLQAMIDHRFKQSKLMIILCGSSISFMEYQVLGYKSPLFGRRTAQFKIAAFNFFETREYHSRFNALDAAVIYCITGGVPFSLEQIDANLSVEENIKKCFLNSPSYLYDEPAYLLKQEVREPAFYNAVIQAIAKGSSRLSEIASKTNIETSACTAYLKNLITLGIVKKEFPFREEVTKKTIYRIDDGMFSFWYRFIPDNASLIQNNQPEQAWKRIQPQLPAFMGGVFEDICKQWLWRENAAERLPIMFSDLGCWWGNDPVRKREAEIDIIAHADDDNAIFCECKWENEKTDMGVLRSLMERSELFHYRNKLLYIFSKTGFTAACEEKAAQMGNVRLVGLEGMDDG